MPTVRIPPGVVRGESRAMVPGRYFATNLVRWKDGNLTPVGGWDRITENAFPSVPRAALTWLDNANRKHFAVLCDRKVYRALNSIWYDITPPGMKDANDIASTRGYGSGNYSLADYGQDDELRGGSNLRTVTPLSFTVEHWGQELLFGHSVDGQIFVWSPETPNTLPVPAPNVPEFAQAFICTEEHHLMVFGGDGFPNRVAWSDQGNRLGWDYTSVTGQAGFFDLEDAGLILSALKVPGGILVFTQTSVWMGQYIGAPYFYGFTRIAQHVAPVSPQAVAVAAGKAYWMGAKQFYKWEGGVVSPLPCTLDLDPSNSIDEYNAPRRVCAGFSALYPEIWWFYPSAGQNVWPPENDRYIIYNFLDGWWADGKLSRSFYTADLIEGAPMAGHTNGHIYQHERGNLGEGLTRVPDVWAEVSSLSFDDGESNWSVLQMQADGRQEAPTPVVRFEFFGVHARGAPYKPLGAWNRTASGYVDARFTAKDFAMRVVGLQDVAWSVGAMNFKVKQRGSR